MNSPSNQPASNHDLFERDTSITTAIINEDDDFNPRAEEFGDFENAFGDNNTTSKSNGKAEEFADFSAFAAPIPAATPISNADLLGGLSTTNVNLFPTVGIQFPQKTETNTADLLSDFSAFSLASSDGELSFYVEHSGVSPKITE